MSSPPNTQITALRDQIARIEARGKRAGGVLPFELEPVDRRVAMLFAAGIAARTSGQVLWCVTRADLFAPSLAQAGLHPDRVIST